MLNACARLLTDLGLLIVSSLLFACLLSGQIRTFDVVNSFQPFWLAASLLVLALAITDDSARRRYAAVVLASINLFLLMAPLLQLPGRAQSASGRELKVLTLNTLWHNRSTDEIVALVKAEDPDIVVLQEVGSRTHAHLNAALHQFYPYRRFCNDEPFCDGAILSRIPWLNVWQLPRTENAPPSVAARFDIGGQRMLFVMGVHFWNPRAPQRQVREAAWLGGELSRIDDLLIIAGDFNLTPWTFGLNSIARQGRLVQASGLGGTWPATSRFLPPIFPIDNILVSPEIRVIAAKRGPGVGSDHLPAIATLRLP